MDNPFRDRVEGSAAFGKAACAAYARAVKAAPGEAAPGEAALRRLVADLNAVRDRFGLIDTLRRDQAADAFFDLAARIPVPRGAAESVFAARNF